MAMSFFDGFDHNFGSHLKKVPVFEVGGQSPQATMYQCSYIEFESACSKYESWLQFAQVVFNDFSHTNFNLTFHDALGQKVEEYQALFVRIEKVLPKWQDKPWEAGHSEMTLPISEAYKIAKLTLTKDEIPGDYDPWWIVIGDQKLPAWCDGATRVFIRPYPYDEARFIGTCTLPWVGPLNKKMTLAVKHGPPLLGHSKSASVSVRHIYRPKQLSKIIEQPQTEMVVLLTAGDDIWLSELPGWVDWQPWIEATKGDI